MIRTGLGVLPPTSSLISSGLVTGTGIAASAGLLTAIGLSAQAVPIVGNIVGGIALAIGALGIGNGCGASCTASTAVVNQIEPYMQQNIAAAQQQASANGGCLTSAEIATLTDNFNQLWNYVVQNCQKVGGAGGSQCVADRQRGGKWDWFNYYLDPINSYPVCSASAGFVSSIGLGSMSPLVIGGIALIGLLIFGGGD